MFSSLGSSTSSHSPFNHMSFKQIGFMRELETKNTSSYLMWFLQMDTTYSMSKYFWNTTSISMTPIYLPLNSYWGSLGSYACTLCIFGSKPTSKRSTRKRTKNFTTNLSQTLKVMKFRLILKIIMNRCFRKIWKFKGLLTTLFRC
jgi:hypothetical protein